MTIFKPNLDGFNYDNNKKKILTDIVNEINNGTKFIILEIPTGNGKSWIAAKVALWLKDACIISPDTKLQSQYIANFSNFMVSVMGKKNFQCMQLHDSKDCSYGDCKPKGSLENCEYLCNESDFIILEKGTENEIIHLRQDKEVCSYWKQREVGELSSFPVYNYNMYLSTKIEEKDPMRFSRFRKVLICDEADQLEDKIVDNLSLEITDSDIKELNDADIINDFKKIEIDTKISDIRDLLIKIITKLELILKLQEEHIICSKYLSSLEHIKKHEEFECKKHTKRRVKKCPICKKSYDYIETMDCYKCQNHKPVRDGRVCDENHFKFNQIYRKNVETKLNYFKRIYDQISINLSDYSISEIEVDPVGHKTVNLMSYGVRRIAQKIFKNFEHVIFMSSTIDKELFTKTMGITTHSKNMGIEFKIPDSSSKISAKKILHDEYNQKYQEIFSKYGDYFYKFDYQGIEFYAGINDFIPNDSHLVKNEKGNIITYKVNLSDIESIDIMNNKNSSFYQTYTNPIPIKSRIVKRDYVGYLNENNKFDLMDVFVKKIDKILNDHKNEKGIIHVTSYDYQRILVEKLSDKNIARLEIILKDEKLYNQNRLKLTNNYDTIDELLENHKSSKEPRVIISPSCWLGVDLKDDYSRFQIILKAPILPRNGAIREKIRKMGTDGEKWYDLKCAYKLVQGCGRSIRSVNDSAVTYLLDANCEKLIKNDNLRPWFIDSVINI